MKRFLIIFFSLFITMNLFSLENIHYLMADRIFAKDFDMNSDEEKPFNNGTVSDKKIADALLKIIPQEFMFVSQEEQFWLGLRFLLENSKYRVGSGTCIINERDDKEKETFCYYIIYNFKNPTALLDLGSSSLQIDIFDFYHVKIHSLKIESEDKLTLLNNYNKSLVDDVSDFPSYNQEKNLWSYDDFIFDRTSRLASIKFNKPILNKKKLSKKATVDEINNFNYVAKWKESCNNSALCIFLSTYGLKSYFTDIESQYLMNIIKTQDFSLHYIKKEDCINILKNDSSTRGIISCQATPFWNDLTFEDFLLYTKNTNESILTLYDIEDDLLKKLPISYASFSNEEIEQLVILLKSALSFDDSEYIDDMKFAWKCYRAEITNKRPQKFINLGTVSCLFFNNQSLNPYIMCLCYDYDPNYGGYYFISFDYGINNGASYQSPGWMSTGFSKQELSNLLSIILSAKKTK